jgi:hypothetical protein
LAAPSAAGSDRRGGRQWVLAVFAAGLGEDAGKPYGVGSPVRIAVEHVGDVTGDVTGEVGGDELEVEADRGGGRRYACCS